MTLRKRFEVPSDVTVARIDISRVELSLFRCFSEVSSKRQLQHPRHEITGIREREVARTSFDIPPRGNCKRPSPRRKLEESDLTASNRTRNRAGNKKYRRVFARCTVYGQGVRTGIRDTVSRPCAFGDSEIKNAPPTLGISLHSSWGPRRDVFFSSER